MWPVRVNLRIDFLLAQLSVSRSKAGRGIPH
jgi:hypothetical protein